jgi:hypothetical protein
MGPEEGSLESEEARRQLPRGGHRVRRSAGGDIPVRKLVSSRSASRLFTNFWSWRTRRRRATCFGSSVLGVRHATSEVSMRKGKAAAINDLRPEYDFAKMKGGIRGKYLRRYRAGTNLVLLEPDLAEAFPDDASVNKALRAAVKMAAVVRRPGRVAPKKLAPRRAPRSRG